MLNRISLSYQFDLSTSSLMVVGWYFSFMTERSVSKKWRRVPWDLVWVSTVCLCPKKNAGFIWVNIVFFLFSPDVVI